MAYGDNWTKEDSKKSLVEKTQKVLKDVKKERSKRKYKLVKVCDHPLTIKEVEIKD